MRPLTLLVALLLAPSAWAACDPISPGVYPTTCARLAWTYPTLNTDGSALTNLASFGVWRRCEAGPLSLITTIASSAAAPTGSESTTWDDLAPPIPAQCWYSVDARNALAAASARSNEVTKAFSQPPLAAPNPPTINGITWALSADPEPPAVASHIGFVRNENPGGGTVTTLAATGTIAVNAGDLLVVCVMAEGADTTLSASDNASGGSNVYTGLTKERHAVNGDMGGQYFWAIAKASETLTFSGNWSSARPWNKVAAWAARPGSGKTFAVDVENTTENSGTGTHTLATTGLAGGVAYAVTALAEYFEPFQVWTVGGSGWTNDYNRGVNSPGQMHYLAHQVLSTETSITGGASTASAAGEGITLNAVFKEVAVGGAASLPPRNPHTAAMASLIGR